MRKDRRIDRKAGGDPLRVRTTFMRSRWGSAMEEKRSIEVEIFGHRYQLKSEFPEEQVKQVAAYVDGKMR